MPGEEVRRLGCEIRMSAITGVFSSVLHSRILYGRIFESEEILEAFIPHAHLTEKKGKL